MTIGKILAVAVLATFSAVVFAGKSGVAAVGSGTGSVIPSRALSEALNGGSLGANGRSLYSQLRPLAETILLADGRVISPDITLRNGTVITLTVAPSGEITDVSVREPDSKSGVGGGSCSA